MRRFLFWFFVSMWFFAILGGVIVMFHHGWSKKSFYIGLQLLYLILLACFAGAMEWKFRRNRRKAQLKHDLFITNAIATLKELALEMQQHNLLHAEPRNKDPL